MAAPENDAIRIIARDMKELVKKIQDLRHIGIEDNQIDLPKICVIGDQSTGKSSLIEGMSEIKVPRSAGTCTRCPMEINLSESDPGQPWTCQVYLSRKYVFDGSRKLKVTKKSQPLGPWVAQDQEDELFFTLNDKSQVQNVIKWAQLAILNPGQPSRDYVPGQNAGTSSYCHVKFSPNVIRLDISAPEFPNLSFYDLPGVISQAEIDEEQYLISLIENLVKEYISQDNCIILLTLPMTDDATNSSAARIMRDVRGAQSRTLGVLTKPDRVQLGESYSQWVEILEGDKFKLGHGYYVVRNNPDPDVEHVQARQEENAFFASNPWATDLGAYQDRFGTRHLQTALSSLLLDQIQDSLPKIIQQIDAKAARINEELGTIPEPPSANVQYILCKQLHNLKDRIRANFNGGSSEYHLMKIWGHIAHDFRRALIKTRPTVQLLSSSDYSSVINVDQDSDCEMRIAASPQTRKRKMPGTPPEAVALRYRSPGYHTEAFSDFDKPAHMFTWEKIREINEDSCRAGIPDQADPNAIEKLKQLSVKHWHEPMTSFLRATHSLVKEMLMRQLRDVFAQYFQTSLFRELKKIIEDYLGRLQVEHFDHALENYEIEVQNPFTMAKLQLEQQTQSALNFLTSRRHLARANCYVDQQGRFLEGDPRRETEIKKITPDMLGPDKFLQEVKMMASVRGYYEVASSRFLDSTCQGVHTKLFAKCRDELITVIEDELGIADHNASERCQELMAPDSERQRRRTYLLKEKEKVSKAQEWLSTVKKEGDSDSHLFCGAWNV